MIPISDDLLSYLSNTTRGVGQYVRVELTTKDKQEFVFRDSDLQKGGLSVVKKSVSGSSFDIGECYINNLTMTVIDKDNKLGIDLSESTLKLYWGIDTETLKEEVLVGTFIVPADTTVKKVVSVQITGDSILSRFNKSIGKTTTSGDLWALVSWCCDRCGVEIALTEEQFNALSENTKNTYYINEDSEIETYLDIIMWVSQLLGGFATDTNDGKLTFKNYSSTNYEFAVNYDTVKSSQLGDTDYTLDGVSMAFDDETIYIGSETKQEYVLELDENPLISSLDISVRRAILDNIWGSIWGNVYRSFSIDFNGNPALECGDIMVLTERGLKMFLTSYTWKYHNISNTVGAGLDKRTKTQSQAIKKASTSGGSGSGGVLNVIRYNSVEDVELGSSEVKLLDTYIALPANVSPVLNFSVTLSTEAIGLLTLIVEYSQIEQLYSPKHTCQVGYNTVTFTCSFDPEDIAVTRHIVVKGKFAGAKSASIAKYDLEANITASGVRSTKPEWTGIYEVKDELGGISLDNVVNINTFTEITNRTER